MATDSTALRVVHSVGVEGHLPVPVAAVLRGRQPRPWLVQALTTLTTATLTDLAGGVVDVALRSLRPDSVLPSDDARCTTNQHPEPR